MFIQKIEFLVLFTIIYECSLISIFVIENKIRKKILIVGGFMKCQITFKIRATRMGSTFRLASRKI